MDFSGNTSVGYYHKGREFIFLHSPWWCPVLGKQEVFTDDLVRGFYCVLFTRDASPYYLRLRCSFWSLPREAKLAYLRRLFSFWSHT